MTGLLQYWWVLALVSGLGLASRNVLFKLSGARIDPALGATILSVSMAVTALIFFLAHHVIKGGQTPADTSRYDPSQWVSGVVLAVLSGVGVALANIFLAYTYQAGGPASLTAILQNAAALSITLLIGALILGEGIQPLQLVGILLAVTGIFFIVKG